MQHINYSLNGKSSSPVCMVFIPGMLCDRSNWALQNKYFQTQYQILSLDLPGHGQSHAKPHQQWDVMNLAADLKRCLFELNLKKPLIIIAHSASVRIALELNYILEEDVAGLVLIDCGYQHIARPDVRQWSIELRHKGYAAWLTQFFSSKFGPSTQALRDAMLHHALKLDPVMGEELFLGIKTYDYYGLEKCLQLTKTPILVLQSSFYKDGKSQSVASEGEVQSEWLDLLRTTVPTAQIQIILHCGHWIMLQQPDICNQRIEQFVQQVLAPSSKPNTIRVKKKKSLESAESDPIDFLIK